MNKNDLKQKLLKLSIEVLDNSDKQDIINILKNKRNKNEQDK